MCLVFRVPVESMSLVCVSQDMLNMDRLHSQSMCWALWPRRSLPSSLKILERVVKKKMKVIWKPHTWAHFPSFIGLLSGLLYVQGCFVHQALWAECPGPGQKFGSWIKTKENFEPREYEAQVQNRNSSTHRQMRRKERHARLINYMWGSRQFCSTWKTIRELEPSPSAETCKYELRSPRAHRQF